MERANPGILDVKAPYDIEHGQAPRRPRRERDQVIPAHHLDDLHPVHPTRGQSHLMLAKIRCL
jgi:hypothetical protein